MLAVVVFPFAATGQVVAGNLNVGVCDVARHPDRYNGRIITVRARVSIAFEDFKLSGGECQPPSSDGVWLEYGKGPKRQPTTWCCGDMVPRDGLRVVQNADFRRFHHYLTAQNRGSGCHEGQCYLYSVAATITGRVDAIQPRTCPNGTLCCTGGFGHFGLYCARLVIQRVSDVVADQK